MLLLESTWSVLLDPYKDMIQNSVSGVVDGKPCCNKEPCNFSDSIRLARSRRSGDRHVAVENPMEAIQYFNLIFIAQFFWFVACRLAGFINALLTTSQQPNGRLNKPITRLQNLCNNVMLQIQELDLDGSQ